MSAVTQVRPAGRRDAFLWVVRAPAPDAPPDAALLGVLDPVERRRAAALRRPADRALYVAAHGTLRRLLGDRLGLPPAEVALTRLPCPGCGGPHGRPAVVAGCRRLRLIRVLHMTDEAPACPECSQP
ncbi:hypothetical protein AB0A67_36435, partial [Streptomyces eurythermus]